MTGICRRSNTSSGPGQQNETLPHPPGELPLALSRGARPRDRVAWSGWAMVKGRNLTRTTGRVRVQGQGTCETEE